jgi:hypothetical protein
MIDTQELGSPSSTSMETKMNRFLPAVAALVLVTGTALAPAFAAAPPGPRASSENNWPGMMQTNVSGYVADPAAGASYPVYVMHHAVPSSGEYPGPDLHGQGGA